MIGLTSAQLHGFSREKAECYGKPHVLAAYTGDGVKAYRHADAPCPICHWAMIANTHHHPDRSVFVLRTPVGTFPLRPALIGLCGSGTAGCHGLVEANAIAISWEWFDDAFAAEWWSGGLLRKCRPHDPWLYNLGGWKVTDARTGTSRLLIGGGLDGR